MNRIVVFAILLLLCVGCRHPVEPTLTVTPEALEVPSGGGKWQITVQASSDGVGDILAGESASGNGWSIKESNADWVTFRVNRADGFVVTVAPNQGPELRVARIRVAGGGLERILTISQLSQTMERVGQVGDSMALVALYNSTKGDKWVFDPRYGGVTWDFTKPFSSWFGVRTALEHGECRVTGIALPGVSMDGALPDKMVDLTSLTILDLSANRVTGDPLELLAKLTKLTYLDLGYNIIGGTFPAQVAQLTALTHLSLAGNDYTGTLPESMTKLRKLTKLDLSNNSLSGDPFTVLSFMTALTDLNLSNNPFACKIAEQISNCSQLRVLNFGGCGFVEGVPQGIALLRYLRELNLANNVLSGMIPARFSSLDSLTILNISGNKISGVGGIERCGALEHLDLSFNDITTLDGAFGSFFGVLKYLDLQGNPLSVFSPTGIGRGGYGAHGERGGQVIDGFMPSLEFLQLSGTQLRDISWVSWCTGLKDLIFNNSKVEVLPEDLNRLSSLERLLASGCLISSVDGSLYDIATLQSVDLRGNRIVGELPIGFGKCKRLTSLNLADNFITGSIPVEILGATALTSLVLHGNNMSGVIADRVLKDKRWCGETITVQPENPSLGPEVVVKPGVWSPAYYICPQRVGGVGFENCGQLPDDDGGY